MGPSETVRNGPKTVRNLSEIVRNRSKTIRNDSEKAETSPNTRYYVALRHIAISWRGRGKKVTRGKGKKVTRCRGKKVTRGRGKKVTRGRVRPTAVRRPSDGFTAPFVFDPPFAGR